ncbi:perosamine synthetase [Cohnella xylanilytica]|nr:perosamine synthetase [Cohnella xylanilytica]
MKECIDTGWVSSVGSYVNRFEKDLAEYTGSGYAIAVVNGTAALHISLLLAGVEAGDEVIVPSLSFVATANAVAYCQATPHFADVEPKTLGLDVERLDAHLAEIGAVGSDGSLYNQRTGKRIRAIVPMHTFGHPVDMESLLELGERYRLAIIEDAAESLGSLYKGRATGTFGLFGILSFNGNKVLTCGGGGAILTQDKELAAKAKHLTTTAKVPHAWAFDHDQVGYNYRMPNINAALGCAQLERVPLFLERKRGLAFEYEQFFRTVPGISFVTEPEYTRSNYWLNTILLDRSDMVVRDRILQDTNAAGILTRPVWTPLHLLPMYAACPSMDMYVTIEMQGRIINLPSGTSLAREK